MKKVFILICIVLIVNGLKAQDYFNRIVPYEFGNPLIDQLVFYNDIFYIAVVPPENYCTMISMRDSIINYYDFKKFVFSYYASNLINKGMYVYGKDRSLSNNLKLIKLNSQFSEQWTKSYKSIGNYCFPTFSSSIGNNLYCSFIVDFKNSNHREIGIKKIDTRGNEIWSKDYNTELKKSYVFDMLPSKDGNLFVSSKAEFYNKILSYGQLMKIDTSGNIIWRTDGTEYFSNGATPGWIAELSDSSIVMTYEISKRTDADFLHKGWSAYPTRMKWYDKDGNPTREKLLVYPRKDEMYLNQVEAGKGDYFFGYGAYIKDEPDDYITRYPYGLLTKYANNGDTIWTHRYQMSAFDTNNVYFQIKDIEELDNGDIVAMGDIYVPGEEYKIWLFKVNSEGCFGADSCEEIQRTDILEIEQGYQPLAIYPNPAKDIIRITLSEKNKWQRWRIYDLTGRLRKKGSIDNKPDFTISDLKDLGSGMYIVKVYNGKGKVGIGKFVVE